MAGELGRYMVNSTPKLNSVFRLLPRAFAGFAAGFVLALFAMIFTGFMPSGPYHDLGMLEQAQQVRSFWIAVFVAFGTSIIVPFLGGFHVSRFWLWFILAFGIICLIPCWPHKGGTLLPFATPYVNSGSVWLNATVLSFHLAVSLAIAATVHSKCTPQRKPTI